MTGLECIDVAQAIESHLKAGSDGNTLLVNGQTATASAGYWLGGLVPSLVMPLDSVNIAYSIYLWLKRFEGWDVDFIGFWVDDGLLYVDLVEWVENEEEAIARAQSREELAIFDITNGESVYV